MPPSISSLASAIGESSIGERTSSVALIELDESDTQDGPILRFQYFPETISDSKSVNWSPKEIPGGSLPLYQWISSGERTIAFQAVFTTDMDFSTPALEVVGSKALWQSLQASGESPRNVDIRSAVLWLRRFMLPRYGNGTQVGTPLTSAPRKLQLHIPGSGIGLAHGGTSSFHDGQDFITAVMIACEVEWLQFFPSGFPRIATVNLSFAQVAQYKGQIVFPAPDSRSDSTVRIGSGEIFPYQLTAAVMKK